MSETEGTRRKERPAVRWKDRVKKYMHEIVTDRGEGIELASRERWRPFCHGYPFGGHSRRQRGHQALYIE